MKHLFLFLFIIPLCRVSHAQHPAYDSIVFQTPHADNRLFAGEVTWYNDRYYLSETLTEGGHFVYDLQGKLLKQLVFAGPRGDTLKHAGMLPSAAGFLLIDKEANLYLFDSLLQPVARKRTGRYRYRGVSYVLKSPLKPGYRAVHVPEANVFLLPVFAYRKPKAADPLKNYHNEAGLFAIFGADLSFRGVLGSLDSVYRAGALDVDAHAAVSGSSIWIKAEYDNNLQVVNAGTGQPVSDIRLTSAITLVSDHDFPPCRKGYDLQNYRMRKILEMTVYNDVFVTPSGMIVTTSSEAVKDTTTFKPVIPVRKACPVNQQLDRQESLYLTKPGRVTVFSGSGQKLRSFPMRYNTGHILRADSGYVYIHPVRLSPVTVFRYRAAAIK